MLSCRGQDRTLGTFTIQILKPPVSSASAPIGTLVRIHGEHFGAYSESGATPYNYTDFDIGQNRVEIGGAPAVIYRWHDDRIDVWVPFSAKSGPVVVTRGGTRRRRMDPVVANEGRYRQPPEHSRSLCRLSSPSRLPQPGWTKW